MQLKNKFIVTEVKTKTKTRMFSDVTVGDVLYMSVPISSASGGGTVYATYINVITPYGSSLYSFTELSGLLKRCFTLEEVQSNFLPTHGTRSLR